MNFGWRRSAATKTAATTHQQTAAKPAERSQVKHAHAEIRAYMVIRDRLLTEAEEVPSNSTLHRACIANDVVEIFLKPAKTPYQAQYLPEDEASHERQRCEAVKSRIAELRGKIATPSAGASVQKPGRPSLFGARAIGTTPA
jgi:hypothetical protein